MRYVIYVLLLLLLLSVADRNAELLGLWLFLIMFALIIWAVWYSLMVFVKPIDPPDQFTPEARLKKRIERIRNSMLDPDEKREAIRQAKNDYAREIERGG